MKKIVLTGGGTAGHVTPNIALFSCFKKRLVMKSLISVPMPAWKNS